MRRIGFIFTNNSVTLRRPVIAGERYRATEADYYRALRPANHPASLDELPCAWRNKIPRRIHHGNDQISGFRDFAASARWSIRKQSASQSAINSCPIVGLSCWQWSAPVSSALTKRSITSTPIVLA